METIPFGYFLWGLACTQIILQCMMDQIPDHCGGVIGIADDNVIHGKDNEPDIYLSKLRKVSHEHSLVFIGGKYAVKQPFVSFFQCVYDKDGVHPTLLRSMQCTTCLPSDTNTTQEVPQHGHILKTICAITFILLCTFP